jgi:hypothetical protein
MLLTIVIALAWLAVSLPLGVLLGHAVRAADRRQAIDGRAAHSAGRRAPRATLARTPRPLTTAH